jgi:hypothetical protein
VFVFWRGFFKDPKQLEAPVRVMERTRIYLLGEKDSAKPIQFPNASGVPVNMLYPRDGIAFDMLARFIQQAYVDPQDMERRGMLAAIGIIKGRPFNPDEKTRKQLDQAARTASNIGRFITYTCDCGHGRLPGPGPSRRGHSSSAVEHRGGQAAA